MLPKQRSCRDAALRTSGRNAVAGISTSGTAVLNLVIHNAGRYQAAAAYSGCAQTADPFGRQAIGLPVPWDALVRCGLATAVMALERVPADIRAQVPTISPNFLLPFRRWGIDPYTERFEVTLHGEGTIRGIGGIAELAAQPMVQPAVMMAVERMHGISEGHGGALR